MRDFKSFIITLVVYSASVTAALACSEQIVQPLKFVSLWNNKAAAKLENLNQIDTLCKNENYNATCLEKHLTPSLKALPVYSTPNAQQPFGALLTQFISGEGGKVSYIPLQNGGVGYISLMELDIFDSDWVYGPPYFHKTMLDNKNDWYKIVVSNAPTKTGWVKLSNPSILTYQKGDIVSFKEKNYTILEIKNDSVSVRDEQPADMWCGASSPPPLKKFQSIYIPIKDLYDEKCNLLMKPSYTRGC